MTMKDNPRSLVIGLDFGSTTTSAAFTIADTQQPNIKILKKWPDAIKWPFDHLSRRQECRSIVYYDATNLDVVPWSKNPHRFEPGWRNMRPPSLVASDFKIRLQPPRDFPKDIMDASPIRGKSVESISFDYLKALKEDICQQVHRSLEDTDTDSAQGSKSIHYIMTVPAFWDKEAVLKFKAIAENAGFDDSCVQKLSFTTSLEAALFHAHTLERSTFNTDDNILVLDSGGSMVEAAIYKIKSQSPFQVQRLTSVSASTAGSSLVLRTFMSKANAKIDLCGYASHTRTIRRMRQRAKRAFERDILFNSDFGREGWKPDLSPAVEGEFWIADLGVEADCPQADLVEGYMSFTHEEIYECFDYVVEKSVNIFREQVKAAKETDNQVHVCLLVGGFNECRFYSDKVQAEVESHGIRVIRPADDGSGLARGAILGSLNC